MSNIKPLRWKEPVQSPKQHLKPNFQVSRKLQKTKSWEHYCAGKGQEKLKVEEELRAQARKYIFPF